MLGLVLLLIALVLYFQPKYRSISYFLYLSFMLGTGGGFGLWTDTILGIKNNDLSIIYTFLINVYLIATGKFRLPPIKCIKSYKAVILFLGISVLFSLLYYQFTPYQILQGGRSFLLLASLPILIRISPQELDKLIQLLIIMVTLTSVLYILQIVLGRPIMPYTNKWHIDPSTGLIRLYNSPANLSFFLTLAFIAPQYFKGNINVYRVLFFVALICTLGRTGIFTGVMTVLLALLLTGRFSKSMRYVVLIGLMFLPFTDMITDRFEKGGTQNDLKQVMEGKLENGGGTMTFRIAWLAERAEYLIERPIGELIFGLGLISDSQPIVNRMYHFRVGLINEETGRTVQLSTADIAYGNLLTKLGFVGSIIYIWFIISITSFFFRHRKIHPLLLVCSAYMITMFISSFAGSGLSEAKRFSFLFIFIPIYFYHLKNIAKGSNHESNSHRIRFRKPNAFLL